MRQRVLVERWVYNKSVVFIFPTFIIYIDLRAFCSDPDLLGLFWPRVTVSCSVFSPTRDFQSPAVFQNVRCLAPDHREHRWAFGNPDRERNGRAYMYRSRRVAKV